MRRERSVVVICKPTTKLAPKGMNIYLQTAVRDHIEDAMANGSFELMRAKPAERLQEVSGKPHTHVLTMQDTALNKTRIPYFYEQGRKQDNAENNFFFSIGVTPGHFSLRYNIDASGYAQDHTPCR